MIDCSNLIAIAKERLADAITLLNAGRYDGAVYLCGYAIEIALKYKICEVLDWPGFPSSTKEFEKYKSLKTHDLDVLLSFTGMETSIKEAYLTEWSAFGIWNPEARYNLTGSVKPVDATLMINSAHTLIKIL